MNELHYYKTADGKGWVAVPTAINEEGLIEATKAEYDAFVAARDAKRNSEASLQRKSIHKQISALKAQLKASDYKAIKFAEGLISAADYASIKAERQAARDQINLLEAQLANL